MSSGRLTALVVCSAAIFAQSAIDGPVVLMIGAPGAGKTTQANALGKAYGLPVINVEDLIAANPKVFEAIRAKKITGIVPESDPVLNQLFEQRIAQPDVAHGFLTAGYPSTKDHSDYLAKLVLEKRLPRPVVIQLEVPDDEVRKRLAKDPKYTNVEQLIKDYRRELELVQLYFPDAEIHKIDGRPKVEDVAKKIRAVLDPKMKARK